MPDDPAPPLPGTVTSITQPISAEGGGLPIHASQFQILIETGDVTIIFLQKVLTYGAAPGLSPTVGHRVVGQISLSHMLAKDLNKQLGNALKDFERQYPIPEISGAPLMPPSQPSKNA